MSPDPESLEFVIYFYTFPGIGMGRPHRPQRMVMLAPSLRLMLVKSGCRRICGETDGPEERTGQNMSKCGLVDHASRTANWSGVIYECTDAMKQIPYTYIYICYL